MTASESLREQVEKRIAERQGTITVTLDPTLVRIIKKDIARDTNLGMVAEADECDYTQISDSDVVEYLYTIFNEYIENDYFLKEYAEEEPEKIGIEENKDTEQVLTLIDEKAKALTEKESEYALAYKLEQDGELKQNYLGRKLTYNHARHLLVGNNQKELGEKAL